MKLEEIASKTNLSRSQVQQVIATARETSKLAYAPYSRYRVGAALLMGDGSIVGGTNVENSSYGLTICAERSAIARAIAEGRQPHGFSLIAVCAPDGCGKAAPCGACRQFLVEFNPQMYVISIAEDDEHELWTAADLLPTHFGPLHLKPESK